MRRRTVLPWTGFWLGILLALEAVAATGRLTGGVRYQIPDWFKSSFLEFSEDAAEAGAAGRHVMLFLHLDECPYCEAVLRESLVESDYVPWVRERFDAIAINVRGSREVAFTEDLTVTEKELAEHLGVRQTPTVIFLDGENRQVMRVDGYRTPVEFKRVLDYVDARAYLEMDLASYVARHAQGTDYTLRPHPAFAESRDLAAVEGPLVVLFEDAWCDACDLLHDTLLADAEVHALLDAMTVVRLDAESRRELVDPSGRATTPRDWVRELGLHARPAFVLFADGREQVRIHGVLRHWHLTTALRYVAEGQHRRYATLRDYSRALRQQQLDAGEVVDLGRQ